LQVKLCDPCLSALK